jgi:DNA-binding transcriptional LysR family regulator
LLTTEQDERRLSKNRSKRRLSIGRITPVEIRQLRYFVAMAETGSLMKASERLHVAQPALSVHLSNLEVELGTKLVIRSNRGIELTPDGIYLYERAINLIKYHQESISALKNRKANPSGVVSIGMVSTIPSLLVPPLYRAVRQLRIRIAGTTAGADHEALQVETAGAKFPVHPRSGRQSLRHPFPRAHNSQCRARLARASLCDLARDLRSQPVGMINAQHYIGLFPSPSPSS